MFQRRNSQGSAVVRSHNSRENDFRAPIEPLEPRQLLAASPHITSIIADNRGWVVLKADADLNKKTVVAKNVLLYTAGADKKLGTADDKVVTRTVSYNAKLRQITIKSSLKVNAAYRVKLLGGYIKGVNGAKLDGEFNGAKAKSGNGVAGGNYDCITKVSSTPYAWFWTTDGTMTFKLNKTACPTTVKNFQLYANTIIQGATGGVWDTTFFHRLTKVGDVQDNGLPVTYGIIQGGGFSAVANEVHASALAAPIALEAGLSNLRGTIAMARGQALNSATNQWYFNYTDNSAIFDGNYAVFGTIAKADLPVLDKLAAHGRVDATGDATVPVGEMIGQTPVYIRSALTDLPVKSVANYNTRGHLDPNKDLIKVTRVSMQMSVVKTPAAAATPRAVLASPTPVPTFSTTPITKGDSLFDEAREVF